MKGDETSNSRTLPLNLRKFLTVTEPDGAPRSGRVERSALLNRLEVFLPRLKSANDALAGDAVRESIVHVEKVAPSSKDGLRPKGAGEEGALRVDMDLYVNESLGELVGGDNEELKGVERDGLPFEKKKKRPLVQIISENESEKVVPVRARKASPKASR